MTDHRSPAEEAGATKAVAWQHHLHLHRRRAAEGAGAAEQHPRRADVERDPVGPGAFVSAPVSKRQIHGEPVGAWSVGHQVLPCCVGQAVVDCEQRQLETVGDAGLLQDRVEVPSDRFFGDSQLFRHLPVGVAARHRAHDLEFTG